MRTLLLSDSNKRVKDVLYGALIIIEGAASCRIEFVFESWVSGKNFFRNNSFAKHLLDALSNKAKIRLFGQAFMAKRAVKP